MRRQGPHQVATNSTRTGRFASNTVSLNWLSLISATPAPHVTVSWGTAEEWFRNLGLVLRVQSLCLAATDQELETGTEYEVDADADTVRTGTGGSDSVTASMCWEWNDKGKEKLRRRINVIFSVWFLFPNYILYKYINKYSLFCGHIHRSIHHHPIN